MKDKSTLEDSTIIYFTERTLIPAYNSFDAHFYAGHIIPVRKFSTQLAYKLKKDPTAYDMAALLHDIGLTLYGPKDHNITGAEYSKKLLKKNKYDSHSLEKIYLMILNHNGPFLSNYTIDDELLRSSDGMAHISEMPYTFLSFLHRNGYDEAKKQTKEKLLFEMEEKITIPLAKDIIHNTFTNAMQILDSDLIIGYEHSL
jgi:hypothetical protein